MLSIAVRIYVKVSNKEKGMLASLKILGEILAFWSYFVHCCMNLFPDKVALKQKKMNEVQRNDQFFLSRIGYDMLCRIA